MASDAGRFDTVVIGAGPNGLVAAVALARSGGRVLVLEGAPEIGGPFREIEFAPGFRAAPLAPDLGWCPREVLRGVGLERHPFRVARPDPTLVAPAGDGTLLEIHQDAGTTAQGLRRFSVADAERWAEFAGRMGRLAGVLETIALSPAPRIDAAGIGELAMLARLGRKVRGLGKVEMIEFLRTMPMSVAELMDDWFETDLLKGLVASTALADLSQGPRAGGTAFTLLHNLMGGGGAFGPRTVLADGPGGLIRALAEQAAAAGVVIRTDAPVASIATADDRVSGVVLRSGEAIEAGEVISSLGPKRTLLEMVDPVHLDPDFIAQVQHVRYRPARAVVLLALARLPELPGSGDGRALGGSFVIAPDLSYLERAFDATKYGATSEAPWLDIRIPSLAQVGLAPGDEHVMVIQAQYTPYWLRGASWDTERETFGDRVVAIASRHLEGLAERVRHRVVLAPPDLEAGFGLGGGSVTQGEMMLDQILFMRPVAGWSRYAMPVPGLFLCGPGTHPGPGATGAPGWLAAQAVLRARAGASSS